MSLITRALLILAPRRRVRAAFTRHYERGDWLEPETVSGRGSSLHRTAAIRRELPALLTEFAVRSVVDAGCGDFNWFGTVGVELDSYLGIEVVDELVAMNRSRHGTRRHSWGIIRTTMPRSGAGVPSTSNGSHSISVRPCV